MSDILIRGMEMPKDCWDCPLINTEPCACKGYSTALEHVTDRHADCPLVPVPPHGRLIDADALIEAMVRMVPWAITDPTENAFLDGLSAAYEATNAAPTIIPAEEGET